MHASDDQLASALSSQIDDGPLRAAVYARVPTGLGFTRMLTPLGNYFIARPAARSAASKITEETDVPLDAAVVLGLTEQALHVWSADPMLDRVGDHLGHVEVAQIARMEATPGRSWQKLELELAGGDTIELEARGAAHALVASWQDLSAAAS